MSPITASARPRSLATFFILAFGISWSVWVPAALASHGLLTFKIEPILSGSLGAFGPTLAALITTALHDGRAGFGGLLKRALAWRVGLRWYLVVLFWPAALSLVTTAISIGLGSPAPDFSQPAFWHIFAASGAEGLRATPLVFLPFFFLQQLLFGSSMGEEIGWRGYALPRLQARRSSLFASLVLGLAWGAWHLPLWLTRDGLAAQASIGWHYLELMATTVLFTWVYNNTHGSLWLALLFHASIGVTGLFLSSAEFHPAISAGLNWGMAALVIGVFGPQRLARGASATRSSRGFSSPTGARSIADRTGPDA